MANHNDLDGYLTAEMDQQHDKMECDGKHNNGQTDEEKRQKGVQKNRDYRKRQKEERERDKELIETLKKQKDDLEKSLQKCERKKADLRTAVLVLLGKMEMCSNCKFNLPLRVEERFCEIKVIIMDE